MSITKEQFTHLCQMSAVTPDAAQAAQLTNQLDQAIADVAIINDLNTDNIPPTYQCFDMTTIWREDQITPQEATREDLLALCPDTADHQIKVPKVL